MKRRYFAFALCLVFTFTILGGCKSGESSKIEQETTTTFVASEQKTEPNESNEQGITENPNTTDAQGVTAQPSANETKTTTSNLPIKTTVSASKTEATTTAKPTTQTYNLTPLPSSAYYGRTLLEKMDNSAVLLGAYQAFVSAVENMKPTVTFSSPLTVQELTTVFYYYHADYPQHFWRKSALDYSCSGGKVLEVVLQYSMNATQKQAAQNAFTAATEKYLKVAATGKNEYEREKLLHDSLARNITYTSGEHVHDAYGALVEGKAVCEGYSRAFQYLLYQAGIQSLIAEGSSLNPSTGKSEAHAWNVVRIDGAYYHVDLTWDDTNVQSIPVVYAYFNETTQQITQDHNISTQNGYPLPNCTATAANYHVKNGTQLKSYSVDSIVSLIECANGPLHVYILRDPQEFVGWFNKNAGAIAQKIGITGSYSYGTTRVGKEVVLRLAAQ